MASEAKQMPILPIEAYTSQNWFDREQEAIFSRHWHYVGLAEDIAETGSYITVQAGLYPMILLRDKDDTLRAFHNICRHRGTQLLRGVGKAGKAITCPYHDWTYSTDGRLLSIPNQAQDFPEVDKECLGLKPGSVGLWRGMLFVHPQADAMPLSEWFAPIQPYLAPYDPSNLLEAKDSKREEIIKANWKIVAENYIDAYHLSHLHSGTLRMYDHKRIESQFIGDHFTFWQPCSAAYAADIEKHTPYPLIDSSPVEKLGAYVPLLFPGIGLSETESSWSVFHIQPLAPDETKVTIRSRVANASSWQFTKQMARSASFWSALIRPKYAKLSADDPMGSADFMAEDIYVCEQQQKALSSPAFEHGPSAQIGEKAVREHQQLILNHLERTG